MTIVAFFDLDYTLLDTSSGIGYIKEIIRQRYVSPWYVARVGFRHRLKQIDFGQAHVQLMNKVGRAGQAETIKFFEEWVERRLFHRLTKIGKEKIAWHQTQGHRVVVISASIEEIVRPLSHNLGLGPDYRATRLAVKNGRYTGQLDGPTCYGSGKVYWAKQWAAENQLDFPACAGYLYTDSSSDLPLLELVQHPVPVNPSPRLAKIAKVRGWKSERFY